ncbi:hypothetical protein [Bacillus toyonensis]|uniref:hypothetical protein n=1 Tax=Bacillus toyonensis TaxID=155322 RepID=UPI003D65A523
MPNKKLKINIDADTSEVIKQIKEVTEAANECVAALEKLEKVTGKFTNKNEQKNIKVCIVLDRKVLAKSIVKQTTDGFKKLVTDIKRSEVNV